jgi:hypothetical protein
VQKQQEAGAKLQELIRLKQQEQKQLELDTFAPSAITKTRP